MGIDRARGKPPQGRKMESGGGGGREGNGRGRGGRRTFLPEFSAHVFFATPVLELTKIFVFSPTGGGWKPGRFFFSPPPGGGGGGIDVGKPRRGGVFGPAVEGSDLTSISINARNTLDPSGRFNARASSFHES